MALARLALRNISKRVTSSSSSTGLVGGQLRQNRLNNQELLKRFMSTNGDQTSSDSKQVAVTEAATDSNNNKSKLFSMKKLGKSGLWRTNPQQFVPQLYEIFPSGLGSALLQATQNINRLFENINLSPINMMGRLKEKDECYKLRYEVPGISKEVLKITIDDNGVLSIKEESKEEKEEQDNDDDEKYWSMMRSCGYYNTSVVLPDDAKTDDIKAELTNGVLHITIPRTYQPKKEPKEVPIN